MENAKNLQETIEYRNDYIFMNFERTPPPLNFNVGWVSVQVNGKLYVIIVKYIESEE